MKRSLLLFFFFIASLVAWSQIPGTITYQGYLTDASGKPKSGTHKLAFNFYDGSTIVATRTISSVNVVNGLFTEIIGKDASGENASLPLTVWSKPITVGITVDTETELPKISLTSMPFAFASQVANSVSGTLISSNIPALDASKITTGTINNALLDADLQDLADGSLSGSKVGTGVVATNITGTLPGSQVGTGISATNITTGALPSTVLDAEIADLADGTLGSLNVSGFTQLGTGAPLIQMKSLTSTTGNAQAFDVAVIHGITISKILAIMILVESSSGTFVGPNYTINAGLQYSYYTTSTEIHIVGASTNSSSILNKPIKITLTYVQ